MHVDVPDFAVIKEVSQCNLINPHFLLFDFWLSHFYSAAIDAAMTFLLCFPPREQGYLSDKYFQGQG